MKYSSTYRGEPQIADEFHNISRAIEELEESRLPLLYAEPKKLKIGLIAICDGVKWNPLGNGIMTPIWYNGTNWLPL